YGIYNIVAGQTEIVGNTIEGHSQAVRVLHHLDIAPSHIMGNMLRNNGIGVALAKNYLAAPNPQLEVNCNSIIDTDQGIVAETDAWLNNLGTQADPAGNSFTNVSQPVVNDGSNDINSGGGFVY